MFWGGTTAVYAGLGAVLWTVDVVALVREAADLRTAPGLLRSAATLFNSSLPLSNRL